MERTEWTDTRTGGQGNQPQAPDLALTWEAAGGGACPEAECGGWGSATWGRDLGSAGGGEVGGEGDESPGADLVPESRELHRPTGWRAWWQASGITEPGLALGRTHPNIHSSSNDAPSLPTWAAPRTLP